MKRIRITENKLRNIIREVIQESIRLNEVEEISQAEWDRLTPDQQRYYDRWGTLEGYTQDITPVESDERVSIISTTKQYLEGLDQKRKLPNTDFFDFYTIKEIGAAIFDDFDPYTEHLSGVQYHAIGDAVKEYYETKYGMLVNYEYESQSE